VKKNRKPRLNRDGLPIDGRDWIPADWQDLHEAMEAAKRTIKERHANDDDPKEPPQHSRREMMDD